MVRVSLLLLTFATVALAKSTCAQGRQTTQALPPPRSSGTLARYGVTALGGIRAGKQEALFLQGNKYLELHFPKLHRIKQATLTAS
jgi:hypothetical protein